MCICQPTSLKSNCNNHVANAKPYFTVTLLMFCCKRGWRTCRIISPGIRAELNAASCKQPQLAVNIQRSEQNHHFDSTGYSVKCTLRSLSWFHTPYTFQAIPCWFSSCLCFFSLLKVISGDFLLNKKARVSSTNPDPCTLLCIVFKDSSFFTTILQPREYKNNCGVCWRQGCNFRLESWVLLTTLPLIPFNLKRLCDLMALLHL